MIMPWLTRRRRAPAAANVGGGRSMAGWRNISSTIAASPGRRSPRFGTFRMDAEVLHETAALGEPDSAQDAPAWHLGSVCHRPLVGYGRGSCRSAINAGPDAGRAG